MWASPTALLQEVNPVARSGIEAREAKALATAPESLFRANSCIGIPPRAACSQSVTLRRPIFLTTALVGFGPPHLGT